MNKTKQSSFKYVRGFVCAVGLGLSGAAYANGISCASAAGTIEDNVEGAIECEYGSLSPPVNPASEENFLETNAFFGIDNWTYAGKSDLVGGSPAEGGESPDINFFASSGSGLSGIWTIDQVAFSNWDSISLLFKDGLISGGDAPIVTYLIDIPATGVACSGGNCVGEWQSPFTQPPFGGLGGPNAHAVSHITAFVSGGNPSTVPAPATLALLGIGLLSMFQVRRRM